MFKKLQNSSRRDSGIPDREPFGMFFPFPCQREGDTSAIIYIYHKGRVNGLVNCCRHTHTQPGRTADTNIW